MQRVDPDQILRVESLRDKSVTDSSYKFMRTEENAGNSKIFGQYDE